MIDDFAKSHQCVPRGAHKWKIVLDGEGGSTLVLVMAMILTLLALGSVFVRLMGSEAMIAENLEARTMAMYLAESGVHAGIIYLQDNPVWPGILPKAQVSYPLAGGTMSYRIDTIAGSGFSKAFVVGTGDADGTRRELEVTVSR